MNSLNILNESTQVSFTYETETLKFQGNCQVDNNHEVFGINSQIMLLSGDMVIGNCDSNGNTSVSIWDKAYSYMIDTAAADFKALKEALSEHYSQEIIEEEV